MDVGALSEALAQGGFQVGRPIMIAQKVAEGFLGQLLEGIMRSRASKPTVCHVSSSNWTRFPGISAPPVDREEIAPRPAWRQCHASIDEKFRSLVRVSDRSKRSSS